MRSAEELLAATRRGIYQILAGDGGEDTDQDADLPDTADDAEMDEGTSHA